MTPGCRKFGEPMSSHSRRVTGALVFHKFSKKDTRRCKIEITMISMCDISAREGDTFSQSRNVSPVG